MTTDKTSKFHVVIEAQAWDQIEFVVDAKDQDDAEDIVQAMIDRNDLSSDGRAVQVRQETVQDADSPWEVNDSWPDGE